MQLSLMYTAPDMRSRFKDVSLRAEPITRPESTIRFWTGFIPCSKWTILTLAAGGYRDWHTTPSPSLGVTLEGETEMWVDDGPSRLSRPGSVGLSLDALGRGHRTRVKTGPVQALSIPIDPFDLPKIAALIDGWPEDIVLPPEWMAQAAAR